MLAGKEMVATIAVKDLATARKFYEGTLGLKVEDDKGTEAHTYRSAGTRLIVYRSQFAGTNQATALNFMVGGEIDNLAKALRERGVKFEHYDMPGMKWEGDVMVGGPDEGRVVQGPRRQHPLHDERMTRRRGVSAAASSFVPSAGALDLGEAAAAGDQASARRRFAGARVLPAQRDRARVLARVDGQPLLDQLAAAQPPRMLLGHGTDNAFSGSPRSSAMSSIAACNRYATGFCSAPPRWPAR